MEISCADRISELPQHILQQILSLLPQVVAVKTCVLSKTWRHHWCTRPNVEFCEESFSGKKHTFKSVVDKTLQRYHDQNLSIHEFRLEMFNFDDSKLAAELLGKWIPKLKIFCIYLLCEIKIDIPSSVFEAESLQKLYLERCTLNQKCVVNVLCKHLKTLHLEEADIEDETLQKIITSCPLIDSLTFLCCSGLSAIKVDDKLHNLKHFEFNTSFCDSGTPSTEINILISSVIERINISRCPVWFGNKCQKNLKSLTLTRVRLSSELFDSFSRKMPILEFLELVSCYGLKEFHLSSRSIKHLSFVFQRPYIVDLNFKVTIDVPNILYFYYSSFFLPSVFSFTTTNSSHEWQSNVRLYMYGSLCCFLKLHELLKELSGSEIYLDLTNTPPPKGEITGDILLQDKPYTDKRAVVVEHLDLCLPAQTKASRSAFQNELFGICHPRNLVNTQHTNDFLSEFFDKDTGKKRHYKWQQELEDVGKGTCYIFDRFRLKWREI